MKTVKTNELSGLALDYAVALAAGYAPKTSNGLITVGSDGRKIIYSPSIEWNQCHALLIDYQIALVPEAHDGEEGTEDSDRWYANVYYNGGDEYTTNMCNSPSYAICRAVVGVHFGDEVVVPEELLK
ncbi:MAG: hypothetical protein MORG_01599 [Morganella sp. (in: enterobacteria)]